MYSQALCGFVEMWVLWMLRTETGKDNLDINNWTNLLSLIKQSNKAVYLTLYHCTIWGPSKWIAVIMLQIYPDNLDI